MSVGIDDPTLAEGYASRSRLEAGTMQDQGSHRITALLQRIRAGDRDAESALFQLAYDELKSIASNLMKNERSSHTLGATGVLHEACIRLFRDGAPDIVDRNHLARLATRVMKHVLVDHARNRNAIVNGGDLKKVGLDLALESLQRTTGEDLQALAEALEQLKTTHPRPAEVVELRFFGGHTMTEIGEILGVSKAAADSDWAVARARLKLLLQESDQDVVPP